jgi:polo-like kinase 1
MKGKFLGKGGFARCYEFTNQETNAIQAAKVVVKASLTKSRAK